MRLAITRPRRRPVRPPPSPEPDSVEWNGVRITFTVIRSPQRKRTLGLRVLGGQVEVRAPVRAPMKDIRAFVEAKGAWVRDKLIEHRKRPEIPPFGYGDSVPYLGQDTPIRITLGHVGPVEVSLRDEDCKVFVEDPGAIYLGRQHFHVTVPSHVDEAALKERVREALTAWYRARAAEHFGEKVAELLPYIAPRVKPTVRISNARSQWGSCSRDGVLRFSWRCMMLDDSDTEYIAVHELAHLKVRNHSRAFWRVVEKEIPNAAVVRRAINQRGRTLPG